MSTVPAPSTPGTSNSQMRGARLGCAVIALVSFAVSVRGAEPEQIRAVWKERRLTFTYSSATTVYSCEAMAGRVSSVLRALGARDDIKVIVTPCDKSTVPTISHGIDAGRTTWEPQPGLRTDPLGSHNPGDRRLTSIDVRLMMPTEVTEEVLAELEKDKSRHELVARVTGNPAARFNDPVIFNAQRQLVTLSHKTIGIEPQECELLEQMSLSIFRPLGMKVVSKNHVCSADSRLAPELVVEAMVPTAFQAPALPPIGTEVPDPGAPAPSGDAPAKPPSDQTPK